MVRLDAGVPIPNETMGCDRTNQYPDPVDPYSLSAVDLLQGILFFGNIQGSVSLMRKLAITSDPYMSKAAVWAQRAMTFSGTRAIAVLNDHITVM